MKLFQLPIKIALVLTWFLIATEPVRSQSGRMSDITMPNPGEVAPEVPTDDAVVGDGTETPTDDAVVGDGTDAPTDDAVVGDGTDAPTDDAVVGDGTDAPNDDVVAGDGTEVPNDDAVVGDGTEVPNDDVVAGDDTTETPTEDTPVEEAIIGDDEIPTEDVTAEENADTPDENNVADDNETETSNENNASNDNDSDAAEREIVDENVMDMIASDDNSEPEIVTSEDDFGATLGENTAGDPNVVTEDNIVSDVGGETLEVNQQVQSNSIVESESNLNTDNSSQSVAEDSVEQNIETGNEVDSQQASTDNAAQTDSVAVEETASDNVDIEVTEETSIDNASETDSVATEETASDSTEIAEETTADNSSETDSVAEDEVAEELIEELEEKSLTAEEKIEEEVALEETEEEAAEEEIEEEVASEETEEEVAEETEGSQDSGQEVDELAYDIDIKTASTDMAIQMHEESQLTQLMNASGMQLYGQVPSVKQISSRLAELGEQTGKNPAFINISLQSNQLEAFVVLPENSKSASREGSLVASTDLNKIDSSTTPQALTLRETIKDTSRKDLIATATKFREEVSDSSKLNQSNYLKSSQELYKVLIEPIEAELEANNIDILVFSMDSGLRLLPLAALHDGEQFLIEKYAVATVPSFGLTDTRYVSLDQSPILAMGASEFTEQAALPTMQIELETIVSKPRQGEVFLNEQFTIDNFKAQNRREIPFPIVHLGTHAEFKAGSLDDSYIQFYDDRLKIPQLQDLSDELGWNSNATPIELLVLSACETALGDEEAELGFAGLAVQAGVKSALASLWYVSDVGTLALMGEFYDQLSDTLVKAEALRQTQLKMLEGNVKVDNKQVELSNGQSLGLPAEFPDGTLTLDHPYFWSSFTLIGNWN